MSGLRESLAEYLAVRRALGYGLTGTESLLRQFLDYLEAAGTDQITVEPALAWATLPGAGSTGTRCGWERSAGLLATCTKSTRGSRCRPLTCCPTGLAVRSPTSTPTSRSWG